MKLYGYWRSSASYRIRIVLNLKGVNFDNVPVMLAEGEHLREAYRQRNPSGFVPLLETNGLAIGQSAAIAEYLEETCREPPLLPTEAAARARVREMMQIIGCDIHPVQNLRILKYLRAEFGQDDDAVAAWCRRWIGEGLAAFEALASERSAAGQYSFGDGATLADAWLIPQVYNARRFGLDLAPYPTIESIDRHCQAQAAFAAAHPSRQPDAPEAG